MFQISCRKRENHWLRLAYVHNNTRPMSCKLRECTYCSTHGQYSGSLTPFSSDIAALSQMTPETALYYSFHRTSAGPTHNFRRSSLGAAAALDELLSIGCKLATKEWVNNHYCFVLWKLAGMVCLDPDAESDPERKRWCWKEVIRQLRYRYAFSVLCRLLHGYPNLDQRYEREIHRGQRPPLRKVVASDANAAAPMVLCVSDISWTEPGNARDGTLLDPEPKLEVTDGWYKVNAEIDEPLKRAVRAGRLRAGHKIAVMNCKVSS